MRRKPAEGALEPPGAPGSLPDARGAGRGGPAAPLRRRIAAKAGPSLAGGEKGRAGRPGRPLPRARRERPCAPARSFFFASLPPLPPPSLPIWSGDTPDVGAARLAAPPHRAPARGRRRRAAQPSRASRGRRQPCRPPPEPPGGAGPAAPAARRQLRRNRRARRAPRRRCRRARGKSRPGRHAGARLPEASAAGAAPRPRPVPRPRGTVRRRLRTLGLGTWARRVVAGRTAAPRARPGTRPGVSIAR